MLALDRVIKHYRSESEDIRALDEISLELQAGEMLALQGPSGSGKTTLLLLAACALRADAGTVTYDGRDLATFGEQQAAQYRLAEVGLISQSPHLMSRVSAVENASTKLLLGGVPLGEAQAKALQWLERVGISELAGRTPEELSGGERQRVAIARALSGEPRLILADEPTAHLDTQRSAEFVAVLRELSREHGRAVLLVTHDPEAAAAADRVLRLRDGRIEDAQPAEAS